MSTTEHKRLWLPDDFVDEIAPMQLDSPDDFIRKTDDGQFVLSARDGDGNFILEGDFTFAVPLTPGEVVIFWPFDDFGEYEIVQQADGSYRTDRFYPSSANYFALESDPYELEETFDRLINSDVFKEAVESDPSPTVLIGEDGNSIAYRFDLDADGEPRFVLHLERPN